jgi:hypothetical protein
MDGNMEKIIQPSKQCIREWLRHRQLKNGPPPDLAQIRRELGWTMAGPARQPRPRS